MPRFLSRDWHYVIVLSGDHLYKMDYRPFLQAHINHRAEITVGVVPVPRESVPGFGILRMEGDWIVEFVEKPREPAVLDRLEIDVATARRVGIRDMSRAISPRWASTCSTATCWCKCCARPTRSTSAAR